MSSPIHFQLVVWFSPKFTHWPYSTMCFLAISSNLTVGFGWYIPHHLVAMRKSNTTPEATLGVGSEVQLPGTTTFLHGLLEGSFSLGTETLSVSIFCAFHPSWYSISHWTVQPIDLLGFSYISLLVRVKPTANGWVVNVFIMFNTRHDVKMPCWWFSVFSLNI